MKKSSHILRNAFITGLIGGILCCVVIIFIDFLIKQKVGWNKLPNPPEETVAILQLDDRSSGVLQTRSGNSYSCTKGEVECILLNITQDELVPCMHIRQNDAGLPKPPAQPGQVIDACKKETGAEVFSTSYMLLYEDNSLWLGKSSDTSLLDMVGANYILITIFCVGGFASFILGLGIFSVRVKIRERRTSQAGNG
jgi:hypothetical protein